MAGIRGVHTKPERTVRTHLHRAGFRYRLHVSTLPGRPDLVLRKYGAVLFVHGCFWHGHKCPMFKMPATRAAFWRTKIDQNVTRDRKAQEELIRDRWRVLTVWECALRGRGRQPLEAILDEIVRWLDMDAPSGVIHGYCRGWKPEY